MRFSELNLFHLFHTGMHITNTLSIMQTTRRLFTRQIFGCLSHVDRNKGNSRTLRHRADPATLLVSPIRLHGTKGNACGRFDADLRHRADPATFFVSLDRLRGAPWQRIGCVAQIQCHAADRATFPPGNRLYGATFVPYSRFVDMLRHAADLATFRLSPNRLCGANPDRSSRLGGTSRHTADPATLPLPPIRMRRAKRMARCDTHPI